MTRRGVAPSAAGTGPFGHLGWAYRERHEFLCAAADFIADGLRRGQWVEFVGEGRPEDLRAELARAVPEVGENPDVHVTTTDEFYQRSSGRALDPATAVAARIDAVHRALAEGHTGFRAVADDTPLVRRPEQRNAFARYEFLMDREMAGLAISGMCAYDVGALGADAAALLCLHPTVGNAAPGFRLCAAPGSAFALEGDIDAAAADTFRSTVQQIWPLVGDPDVVIDVAHLDYLDHNELLGLDDRAGIGGGRITLRGAGPVVRRLVELLGPAHVRLEPAA